MNCGAISAEQSACLRSHALPSSKLESVDGRETYNDNRRKQKPTASVERNRRVLYAPACTCTCNARKAVWKWANGLSVVNPDCKRAFIIPARRGVERSAQWEQETPRCRCILVSRRQYRFSLYSMHTICIYVKRDLSLPIITCDLYILAINTVLRSQRSDTWHLSQWLLRYERENIFFIVN